MKILKFLLYAVVVIIAVVLITALFVKKDYTITRTVVINKPKTEVFNYVKYLKNQNNYSKWANIDPKMKKEFRGTDATSGFVSAWDSEDGNVGKGEQKITGIQEGKRIDYELHFIKPIEGVAPAYMATDSVAPGQTKVTWTFEEHMAYPFNFAGFVFNVEKKIGDDLQTGLNNLKTIMEK